MLTITNFKSYNNCELITFVTNLAKIPYEKGKVFL